jgi:hypothetical protein
LSLSAVLWCPALAAQRPTPPPADTTRVRRDTTRAAADSAQNPRPDQPITPRDTSQAVPDSANPDSLRPVMPSLFTGAGPRPAGTRYLFDADALRWSGAISLGELLLQIPGVYAVRAGSHGQPETISYMGQGASSIELYRDGYQLDPLGEDSVSFDTGRFDIGQYRSIEVEVLPTVLRIHFLTDTQSAMRARTEASFATGDASTNSYRVRYLNRWRGGSGLGIGMTYTGTQGPPTSRAKSSELALWGKLTWMPSERAGVELQANAYTFDAETITPLGTGGVPIPGRHPHRSDLFVRAFTATRADGLGLRFDALLGSSTYGDTSGLQQAEGQAAFTLSYRGSRWSAEGWGRLRDGTSPFEAGTRLALSPLRMLTLSGSARERTVLGGGDMQEVTSAAEVRLLPWVALHGDLRWRRLNDSLFVASDSTETVLDWSAGLGVTGRVFSFDASLTRRGDFSAPAFGLFRAQLPGTLTAGATAPQVSYRFQPRPWFSISGWFRQPSTDSVQFDPPRHSITRFTFRSMFLPHFRRGAFDLQATFEFEGWGSGVAGRDAAGAPIALAGHTVLNFYLQFRLVGALIYWSLRNTQLIHYEDLPGFTLPRNLQRFGIRWEFTN